MHFLMSVLLLVMEKQCTPFRVGHRTGRPAHSAELVSRSGRQVRMNYLVVLCCVINFYKPFLKLLDDFWEYVTTNIPISNAKVTNGQLNTMWLRFAELHMNVAIITLFVWMIFHYSCYMFFKHIFLCFLNVLLLILIVIISTLCYVNLTSNLLYNVRSFMIRVCSHRFSFFLLSYLFI